MTMAEIVAHLRLLVYITMATTIVIMATTIVVMELD